MKFVNRVSTYPNRYTMTDENGNVSKVVLERDDYPTVVGTPLNAETFNSLYLASEAQDFPGCFYCSVDGESEFMNPPMVQGTQRTAKRFNGYPVYATVVNVASLPGANKDVTYNLTGYSRIVGFSVLYYSNENGKTKNVFQNPWINKAGILATASVFENKLSIVCGSGENTSVDFSKYGATCVIEWTREVVE